MFEEKYKELISTIVGNQENTLIWDNEDGAWVVEASNPSDYVNLGESDGDIVAYGSTLDDLLIDLEKQIKLYNEEKDAA